MKIFEKKYNVDKTTKKEIFENIVFDNLDEIGIKFNKNYIQTLQKYKHIIITYHIFLHKLQHSHTKRIVFPNNTI